MPLCAFLCAPFQERNVRRAPSDERPPDCPPVRRTAPADNEEERAAAEAADAGDYEDPISGDPDFFCACRKLFEHRCALLFLSIY